MSPAPSSGWADYRILLLNFTVTTASVWNDLKLRVVLLGRVNSWWLNYPAVLTVRQIQSLPHNLMVVGDNKPRLLHMSNASTVLPNATSLKAQYWFSHKTTAPITKRRVDMVLQGTIGCCQSFLFLDWILYLVYQMLNWACGISATLRLSTLNFVPWAFRRWAWTWTFHLWTLKKLRWK